MSFWEKIDSFKEFLLKYKKSLLIIASLSLIVVILILLRNQLSTLFLYWYLKDQFEALGWNENLAAAISLPLALWVMFVIGMIFAGKPETKRKGMILGVVTWAIWCVGMFLIGIGADVNFWPDGTPRTCYADTPLGRRECNCEHKVDLTYGVPCNPITPQTATDDQISKNADKIGKDNFIPTENTVCFSPKGDVLCYYYEFPDGKIELFYRKGRHPQTNVELKPVTEEVMISILKKIAEDKRMNLPPTINAPTQAPLPSAGSAVTDPSGYQPPNMHGLQDLADELDSLHKKK